MGFSEQDNYNIRYQALEFARQTSPTGGDESAESMIYRAALFEQYLLGRTPPIATPTLKR